MESHIVEPVERSLLILRVTVDPIPILLRLQGLLTRVVRLVAGIDSLGIAADGKMTIYNGVLAGKVGLVEVVRVPDVRAPLASFDGQGGVGTDEHGYAASATSGTGIALLVQCDVASHHNGVPAVPRRGLDPVYAVEECICAAVAGVYRVHTLNVVVAGLLEQLHQDGLDRLGLVEERLGADLKAANRFRLNVVLLEKRREGRQRERVNVCAAPLSVLGAGFAANMPQRAGCRYSPSRSSQKDILVWPRPMVYLPCETPSNFSSSAWSTHCTRVRRRPQAGEQQQVVVLPRLLRFSLAWLGK